MRPRTRVLAPALFLALCSCATNNATRLDRAEQFNVENSAVIAARGGFEGILVIGDDPSERHGQAMRESIVRTGIPGESVVFFDGFKYISSARGNIGLYSLISEEWRHLRAEARVVHLPLFVPLYRRQDRARVAGHNIVFVVAAGNTRAEWNGDRNLWRPEHPLWEEHPEIYRNTEEIYGTGKVLIATSARKVGSNDVAPLEGVVRCGNAKEVCFTVLPEQSTSNASARLAAMAFYLAQIYPTAEEVVETLGECAIDVGEPGTDGEFGRGVASLACSRVERKEEEYAERVSESAASFTPILNEMLSTGRGEGVYRRRMISRVWRREGRTEGYAGLALTAGNGARGILLAGREGKARFARIGVEKPLVKGRATTVTLLGIHGRQWGEIGGATYRIGLRYKRETAKATLSFYAGGKKTAQSVGLPGYRAAGAGRTSIDRFAWEARVTVHIRR